MNTSIYHLLQDEDGHAKQRRGLRALRALRFTAIVAPTNKLESVPA